MAELQMTFVFTIGFTPGVFGVVRALQSMLVEFALQLAFLEFSTIGTGILRFKKKGGKNFMIQLVLKTHKSITFHKHRLRRVYLCHLDRSTVILNR